MKLAWVYDHNNGQAEWSRRELDDWLTDVFEVPAIGLRAGVTTEIRRHVRTEFEKEGWAINVKIAPESELSVFALKDDLAVHLQTGNMSRAPYDLLKLEYLKTTDRIEAAALALPTKAGAVQLGSNIAHAERVRNELSLFRHIITVPILVVAFE
jgi:hypothetical protein